jgi:hypothetical protein
VAKSVPALANRDLLRGEDGQGRFPGVLGVFVPGAKGTGAIFEVDGENGSVRQAEAKKPLLKTASGVNGKSRVSAFLLVAVLNG